MIILRMVAGLNILVAALILTIDFRMVTDGRPEATMLWLLIHIGERTHQPSWMAGAMWTMPLWMGVFVLLMPQGLVRPRPWR